MKLVLNKGIYSEGQYKAKIDGVMTREYKIWFAMLQRCYGTKKLKSYKDCEVCNEWLNYQTFAKWINENWYECNQDRMHLDKDILCKDNKIYSPDLCILVPQRINELFTKSDAKRGKYPIGVSYHNNKFRATCSIMVEGEKKQKFIGSWNTPEQAFYDGYKPFKEEYIKEIADDYKSQIPQKLYKAMYLYVVEITD